MKFDYYETLVRKIETITGQPYNFGQSSTAVKRICTAVNIEHRKLLLEEITEVRQWCEDHFHNNWIYEWDTFYFKHPEDATHFSLRWV